jgi:hypothetical protein
MEWLRPLTRKMPGEQVFKARVDSVLRALHLAGIV